MNFSKFSRFSSGFLPLIYLFLAACTIIKDTDITGLDQLSKLKLKSIGIIQDTNIGNESVEAPVALDSKGRILSISIPRLSPYKLRYRSQLTGAVTIDLLYDSLTKNWTARLRATSSTAYSEIYKFQYDNSGRLNRIITNIFIGADTLHTKDSLIYSGSTLKSIIRHSFDPSKAGTISLTYNSSGLIDPLTYNGVTYNLEQGNCPNGSSSDECGGYQLPANAGSPRSFHYFNVGSNTLFSQVAIEDLRVNSNSGNSGNNRDLDTYYFHPSMIFKNQFQLGNSLMVIYMIDWWVPGATTTQLTNYTKNDAVTFNFNYGF